MREFIGSFKRGNLFIKYIVMNLLYGKDTITVYGDISGKPRD
jgi:hypothetical protein